MQRGVKHVESSYANALTEVLTLFLHFLDEKDFEKIPREQLEYMKHHANFEYSYEIDYSKPLEEQKISKEASAIILSLYQKYFATPEESNQIYAYLREHDNNLQNHQQEIAHSFWQAKEEPFVKNSLEVVEGEQNKALMTKTHSFSKIFEKLRKILHLK